MLSGAVRCISRRHLSHSRSRYRFVDLSGEATRGHGGNSKRFPRHGNCHYPRNHSNPYNSRQPENLILVSRGPLKNLEPAPVHLICASMELMTVKTVCESIPERGGIGQQPQSATSNDQISYSPRHMWRLGSGCYRFARFWSSSLGARARCPGKGRPAPCRTGCPKLFPTGLAQLRHVLFA